MLLTANPSDGLITWIACPPSPSGLLCRCALGPLAVAARPRCHAMGHLALAETGGAGWMAGWHLTIAIALILPHSPMRRLLPLAGNEEVLQDGHWWSSCWLLLS